MAKDEKPTRKMRKEDVQWIAKQMGVKNPKKEKKEKKK